MINLQGDMKHLTKEYNYSVFFFAVRDGEQGCSWSHVGSQWDLFYTWNRKGGIYRVQAAQIILYAQFIQVLLIVTG